MYSVKSKIISLYSNYSKHIKKNYAVIIILLSGIILYNYFWDIIVAAKIYSLEASVFDLGVFYQRLWIMFFHPTMSLFLNNIQNSAIVIIMSPLSMIHSLFFFVYLQTFWLSITAIPLYFIAYKQIKSKFLSLLIAISFLLFFGIAGINWFDAHFQSLFIPLFIGGFALMLYGKNKSALVLLILSGLTRFPYIIFPLFLGFSYIIEKLYYHDFSMKKNKFYYYLFFISLLFTVIGFIHIGTVQGVISDAHGSQNFIINLKNNLDNKVFTFFLVLAPFLMIPLLVKKWALMMVPFFFLVFVSGYGFYVFPAISTVQYYSGIVPFLYLGFIEGVQKLTPNNAQEIKKKRLTLKFENKHKIVLTMFILIILLGVLYEPYGYLNNDTSANFGLHNTLNYNKAEYNELNNVIELIPGNEPYVLYQDNMPEVNLRDPMAQIGYTFSSPANDTFHIDNHWTGNISYIIVDPVACFNSGLLNVLNHYIKQGDYGIEAENNGIVLLAKGYTSAPVIYKGENIYENYNNFYNFSSGAGLNSAINMTNIDYNDTLFYTQPSLIVPGNYKLTVMLTTSNNSTNNYFDLNVSNQIVKIGNISNENKWINETIPVSIKYYYNSEMYIQNIHWNGNLKIKDIELKQVSV